MASLATILRAHDSLRLGASEIGVAAGVGKYMTPLGLYIEKLGLAPAVERGDPRFAEWGLMLEPTILRAYARRRGCYVLGQDVDEEPCLLRPEERPLFSSEAKFKRLVGSELVTLITDTCVHPDHEYLFCHFDGIQLGHVAEPGAWRPEGVVQAKNTSQWNREAWEGDDPLLAYEYQVRQEVSILRATLGQEVAGALPGLIGGNQLLVHDMEHDEETWELLAAIGRAFVQRLHDERPPPPTPDRRGRKDLERLTPGDTEAPDIILRTESPLMQASVRLGELRRLREQAEALEEAEAVRVQSMMGNSTKVLGPGISINWSPSKPRTRTSWKGLAQALREHVPEGTWEAALAEHSSERMSSRRFSPNFDYDELPTNGQEPTNTEGTP